LDNGVLRGIFGPKVGESGGEGWGRLQNEELPNFYPTPNSIRVIKSMSMRSTEHVARMVEMRNAYKILIGKPEGKRTLERLRRGSEGNIRLNHREIYWEHVDCNHSAQDWDQWRALVNPEMNLSVCSKAGNFLTS
jgi:hypothetical protein